MEGIHDSFQVVTQYFCYDLYNKKTAWVCFWSENITRVIFWLQKHEWPRKAWVIFCTPKTHECCFLFITCHHLLGNRDFNGHFVFKKIKTNLILPCSAACQITSSNDIASLDAFAAHHCSLGLTSSVVAASLSTAEPAHCNGQRQVCFLQKM
jgi:hypothetical protein